MTDLLSRLRSALATRYRLERELGAGGMATVYLAQDLRHERDVAIKVLHPDLGAALGGERFLAEIRTTARLQHPHILPLLDSGDAGDGLLYYVMPYVRGETLRARLERERQLPLEDAVRIAREVADALQHAHAQGIIHRDVKPENILLQDGHALVADFGIALAVQQAGGQRMTQTGLSLGTPQYMSPEQAMGERAIDARSDVYALGAVTYEMLAGEPPFTGPTVQAIVARLISEEPRPLATQRRAIPPHVETAVLGALEKLPADRIATAAAFAAALDGRGTATTAVRRDARSHDGRRPAGVNAVLGALAALSTVAALGMGGYTLWHGAASPAGAPVIRYRLVADSVSAERTWTSDVNISPDGLLIVRRGGPGERVLVRRRDALEFTALAGTEGAMGVVFSPDGARIAFYQEGRLVVMPVTGGPPTVIADSLSGPETVAWATGDVIYRGGERGGLVIVRCPLRECRQPEQFSVLDTAAGEQSHMHPEVLPDGRTVLYQVETRNGARRIVLQRADVRTHTLLTDGVRARFVAPDHLLYSTVDGKLWVAPFDVKAAKLGDPALVADELPQSIVGPVDFAVSTSGTLVYSEGRGMDRNELVWVTRDGIAVPFDSTWRGAFSTPVLTPDGRRLAVAMREGGRSSIWIRERGGRPVRLTTGGNASEPAWSPDGLVLTFLAAGDRPNTGHVWRQRADGSDVARVMVRGDRPFSEQVWLPDGSGIVVRTTTPTAGSGDLLVTHTPGDTVAVPLVATPRSEYSPAVSPDGRWLAFASNVSGRFEVYVVPRDAPGTSRVLASVRGGNSPRWSPDGKSLYYLDGNSRLMQAMVAATPTLRVTEVRALIDARGFIQTSLSRRNYDVAPDGRFLFVRHAGDATAGAMIVVEGFAGTLSRAAGAR